MKIKAKIIYASVCLLPLGACFEVQNSVTTKFEPKFSLCPLNKDVVYDISVPDKNGTKKIGKIQTRLIYGGACSIKNLEGMDFANSQFMMAFIGARFYDLGNNISVGLNGTIKTKPKTLDQFFVFASKGQNGEIAIYAKCSESELKAANQPNLSCAIKDFEALNLLAKNTKYLKPSIFLKPAK